MNLKQKYLRVCEERDSLLFALYQCCECEKEIEHNDYRVEVPEKNEVWCVECFYKTHEIIT